MTSARSRVGADVAAQDAADAAVGDADGVAVEFVEPCAAAGGEIGIAFAALGTPVVGIGRAERRGLPDRRRALRGQYSTLPGAEVDFLQAVVGAVAVHAGARRFRARSASSRRCASGGLRRNRGASEIERSAAARQACGRCGQPDRGRFH